MKLLLTSAGITNPSLQAALLELLGKPLSECRALCVPTALHAQPGGTTNAWQFVGGREPRTPMVELGWRSVGLLELSALPSAGREVWEPALRETDVLLVGGGDPLFLAYWLRESGVAALLPSLPLVYVGLSAGSMVMAPRIGEWFVGWTPPSGGDRTLGLVDFALFPHLDHPDLPFNTLAYAQAWAGDLGTEGDALDDQTGLKLDGDTLEVVAEGHWQHFTP